MPSREYPIIFQSEMIQAIKAHGKSETRRVVWPLPPDDAEWATHGEFVDRNQNPLWRFYDAKGWQRSPKAVGKPYRCPYGSVGDRLWVREALQAAHGERDAVGVNYAADDAPVMRDGVWASWQWAGHELSPIFMPRWASRFNPVIANIRLERVQQITGLGALAEGIKEIPWAWPNGSIPSMFIGWRAAFGRLWDSIHNHPRPVILDGKVDHYVMLPFDGVYDLLTYRGKPCHVKPNPWVWVITFIQKG